MIDDPGLDDPGISGRFRDRHETRIWRDPRRQQPAPEQLRSTGEHPLSTGYGFPATPHPGPGNAADYPTIHGAAPFEPPAAGREPGREPERRPREHRKSKQDDPSGPWPTRVSGPSAIAAVGLVILVGTVGAIGLPRLFSSGTDEDTFKATSLTQPAEVSGLPRLPEAEVTTEDRRSAEQLLSAVRTPLTTQTAVYARPSGVRLTVVSGRPETALADRELDLLQTGFTSGMQSAAASMSELDPGALGGWFGCAQTEHGRTLCLAMDAGALVSITVTSKDPSAIALAQAARQSVEHRTS
jgi:hypothetical protein